MSPTFGLDFGTTNSLAAIIQNDRPIFFLDENLPHPSLVWYHGGKAVVGRKAKAHLESHQSGVIGDIVRSPKRYLGSGLGINAGGVSWQASDVVSEILKHIREDALSREYRGLDFERMVMTIPVNMSGRARADLREAALKANLRISQYVHEPLAALYAYIRSQEHSQRKLAELEGRLVLVFDWGGGTLDLTLCKFMRGMLVQVQSVGDDDVGGDLFDERLKQHVKEKHIKLHQLDNLSDIFPGSEAKLIEECERAKIQLSTKDTVHILVPNYLRTTGPKKDIELSICRDELWDWTNDLINKGIHNIDSLLDKSGLNENSITFCLATGGMVHMPRIKELLLERFGISRLPQIKNGDRIIAEGAAWIAHDELRVTLAKPFELLHADNSYLALLNAGTSLPAEGEQINEKLKMYCVDPRDGFAKFQFARPKLPDRNQPSDSREIYTSLTIKVDDTARPFLERLDLQVEINQDLVVTATASSSLRGDRNSVQVHNLEFGLGLPETSATSKQEKKPADGEYDCQISKRKYTKGSIVLRSNITNQSRRWDLVPGEEIRKYNKFYFDVRNNPPRRQIDENLYYEPCSRCNRFIREIKLNGCTRADCIVGV